VVLPVEVGSLDVVFVGVGFILDAAVPVTRVCGTDDDAAQLERNSSALISAKESQERRACLALLEGSGQIFCCKFINCSLAGYTGLPHPGGDVIDKDYQ